MSLLWRDEVSIYLAPRRIALARRARGLAPRVVASVELPIPDGSIQDCAAALAGLRELCGLPAWQNADARVVVADSWARYTIVPSQGTRLDATGRRAHARYMLADVFGEALADWDIALEEAPPDHDVLACAMFAPLRPALMTILTGARLRLRSLQPQLVVAYNAWRRRIPPNDSWFVTLEEGWLAAVHLTQGAWDRVHSARLSNNAAVDLERLRAFGRLTRDADGAARMLVEAPSWLREQSMRLRVLPRTVDSDFEWLEAATSHSGAAHELELLLQARP